MGRWYLRGGTWLHPDRLWGDRADIFTHSASGADKRIDSDSCPRNKFDRFRFTSLHAGKAAATSCQAGINMCNRDLVLAGCGVEIPTIRNVNGRFWWTFQGVANRADRLSKRRQTFPEEILAADVHFFVVPFLCGFTALISPGTWHPVQVSRSGCGVSGAPLMPVRWHFRQYSPFDVSLIRCGILGGVFSAF